jgi:hypothetical protein
MEHDALYSPPALYTPSPFSAGLDMHITSASVTFTLTVSIPVHGANDDCLGLLQRF